MSFLRNTGVDSNLSWELTWADENSGAQWFTVEEALEKSSEAWVRDNIYRKLVAKLK